MSSIRQESSSVGESERMTCPINVSPRVVRFIENRVKERVISINTLLNADGYRFYFASVGTIIFSSTYIEHIEREVDDQGLLSRNQFEEMVMQKQDIDSRFSSPSDVYPEYIDRTTLCGQNFDMCVEDELGEAPELSSDRFSRSLRKVYWHRYLKKHEQ